MMAGTMAKTVETLPNPPIVEAILDVECDLPPGQPIDALEGAARAAYTDRYPKARKQFVQEHQFEAKPEEGAPEVSVRPARLPALQFLQEDEKQIVQVRAQGFSFNRFAPYTSLDNYLSEVERTWHRYVELAKPMQIRLVRLRYINRILLPLAEGRVTLGEYFFVAPRLPLEDELELVGFLNQHAAVERATGHQVNIVLTAQKPEDGKLAVILDNGVAAPGPAEPDWGWIDSKIHSLRGLKNRIFEKTVTPTCLNLFRQA
jgi:uncharacterized protein (TIGR04255 family)